MRRRRASRTLLLVVAMLAAGAGPAAASPVDGPSRPVAAPRPSSPAVGLSGGVEVRPAAAVPDLVSVATAPDATSYVFTEVIESTTGTVPAGGTFGSAPFGVGATAGRPVFRITSPVAGTVGITASPSAKIVGHRGLGGASITAPAATAAEPLRISIAVDLSSVGSGLPIGAVTVLRNGGVVADCTSIRAAAPDPCVLSRARVGGELVTTVLSSAGGTWAVTRPIVQRVYGDTRILSAIAASRGSFEDRSAEAVVLVRSDDFADSLAATPLANARRAPLLLTARGSLSDETLAEITRVLTPGKTVYLLGGVNALSASVAERVGAWGYRTVRYFGATRYQTAVAVAKGLGSPGVAILTNGLDYGDAIAAGSAAVKAGAAVLLTEGAKLPGATASYLSTRRPVRYAIGRPAAQADRSATPIVGADRYETAILAAKQFFLDPPAIGIVSGLSFADALSGGAHIAAIGGPLLAVPPSGPLPVSVRIYLRPAPNKPPAMFLYGGVNAVGDDVADALRGELGG